MGGYVRPVVLAVLTAAQAAVELHKGSVAVASETPAADADWLASAVTVPRGVSRLAIHVGMDLLAVFKVKHNLNVLALNDGAPLPANAHKVLHLAVIEGDTVNFQADQAVTIKRFLVEGFGS